MKVQCVICDEQNELEDDTPLAKKLRNRPIHTYMCEQCHNRIEEKTRARFASGQFHLYSFKKRKMTSRM